MNSTQENSEGLEDHIVSIEGELWSEKDALKKYSRHLVVRELKLENIDEQKIVLALFKLLDHKGIINQDVARAELAQEEIRYQATRSLVEKIQKESNATATILRSCPNVKHGMKVMMDHIAPAKKGRLPDLNLTEHKEVLKAPF